MFQKCASCNARILGGGQMFLHWDLCSDDCAHNFRAALVDQIVPPEVTEQPIQEVFESPCPSCGRPARNDVYSATKISAFLIMFQINTQKAVCCSSCGRKNRLQAALHCLFAGWWGPKAAFCNVFVLPTNLIAAALIRSPKSPSPELVKLIKSTMAESLAPQILKITVAQETQRAFDSLE